MSSSLLRRAEASLNELARHVALLARQTADGDALGGSRAGLLALSSLEDALRRGKVAIELERAGGAPALAPATSSE